MKRLAFAGVLSFWKNPIYSQSHFGTDGAGAAATAPRALAVMDHAEQRRAWQARCPPIATRADRVFRAARPKRQRRV